MCILLPPLLITTSKWSMRSISISYVLIVPLVTLWLASIIAGKTSHSTHTHTHICCGCVCAVTVCTFYIPTPIEVPDPGWKQWSRAQPHWSRVSRSIQRCHSSAVTSSHDCLSADPHPCPAPRLTPTPATDIDSLLVTGALIVLIYNVMSSIGHPYSYTWSYGSMCVCVRECVSLHFIQSQFPTLTDFTDCSFGYDAFSITSGSASW